MTGPQPGDVNDDQSPYGPPSPLEGIPRLLRAPITGGFALGLAVLLLIALAWVDHRQSVRMDQVEVSVSNAGSSVDFGPAGADPQMCWLLGVVANGQGNGDLVARMDASADSMSDCHMYATRGARGQDLDGN